MTAACVNTLLHPEAPRKMWRSSHAVASSTWVACNLDPTGTRFHSGLVAEWVTALTSLGEDNPWRPGTSTISKCQVPYFRFVEVLRCHLMFRTCLRTVKIDSHTFPHLWQRRTSHISHRAQFTKSLQLSRAGLMITSCIHLGLREQLVAQILRFCPLVLQRL